MSETYSTYDAKAKFSEVLRKVRGGQTITISYHGKPVAEIRPIAPATDDLEGRLQRLEDDGVLVRAAERQGKLCIVTRRPGALRRFMRDRNA